MSLKHRKSVNVADDPAAAGKLRPSDWGSPYTDYDTAPTHVFDGGALGALAMRDTGSIDGFSWVPSAAGVLISDGDDEVPAFRALVAGDIPALAYAPADLTGYVENGDIVSLAWGKLTDTPTSLAGYGIADPIVLTSGSYADPAWVTSLAWGKLTGVPTTLAGYGITDAIALTSGSYADPAWITSLAGAKITGSVAAATLAAAATVLATPRTINGVAFDGSGNVTIGAAAADITGTLGVTHGGTGLAAFTVGDLPYASGVSALSTLAAVATGSVLVSGGVGAAPAWSTTPTLTSLTLTAVIDAATYGAELVTNGGFAVDLSGWTVGAGWAWSAGKAAHTAGNAAALSQNIAVTNGVTYQVTFVISNATAGGAVPYTVSLNGVDSGSDTFPNGQYNGTRSMSFVANTTGSVALTFTPASAFDGKLDSVSVKAVTALVPSILTFRDTAANAVIETRVFSVAQENTVFGRDAGRAITSGTKNTIAGFQAGYNATAADYCTAFGHLALFTATNAHGNTALGYQALYANTSGYDLTAVGRECLYSNTSGHGNVGVGFEALFSNTTGGNNTGVGQQAGSLCVSGNDNTYIGYRTFVLATGSNNTAMGSAAGYSTTTGVTLTALGASALYSNTTGSSHVAIGFEALKTVTTVNNLTAVGYQALKANTSGTGNAAFGYGALQSVTTGTDNVGIGDSAGGAITGSSDNTHIGYTAALNNTGGNNTSIGSLAFRGVGAASAVVAIGTQAGFRLTSGDGNSVVGYLAGQFLTSGIYNVHLGNAAGSGATTTNAPATDDYGVLIGYQANRSVATGTKLTNYIGIGQGALVSKSNQVVLGNTSITETVLRGYVEMAEITDPAAPAADTGRLYFRDNGAGKTQLVVRFPTGAVQVIATEP